MASIIQLSEKLTAPPPYYDRKSGLTREEVAQLEARSSTVYVGNLAFNSTEEQIYQAFVQVAPIKRIIMGINKRTGEHVGFCFVEYFTHEAAMDSIRYLDLSRIGNRQIKVNIDRGFTEGRQYGRGQSGFQKCDEIQSRRNIIDSDRMIMKQRSGNHRRNTR